MHRTAISAVDIHSQTCLINASNVAISRSSNPPTLLPSTVSRHFAVNESRRSKTTLMRTLTKTAGAAYCAPCTPATPWPLGTLHPEPRSPGSQK